MSTASWVIIEIGASMPDASLTWRAGDTGVISGPRIARWERTVPLKVSGEPAAFNPDFIATLNKAAGILGHRVGQRIKPNGTSAALVAFDDPAVFGVIMPMRATLFDTPPEWFALGVSA